MPKAIAKKKNKEAVIEPEVVGEVKELEVEQFETATATTEDGREFTVSPLSTFTVKLDTKRLDNRDLGQVVSLVHGALGSVKKIVIEAE